MEKVDAIHFIVTKADTLGDMVSDRNEKAAQLLSDNYAAALGQIKDFVRRMQRINASTNYMINAYLFLLASFVLEMYLNTMQQIRTCSLTSSATS